MMRLVSVALLSSLLAACGGYGLHHNMSGLRAEIETLERDLPPEAPFWIAEGENAFDKHLDDFTANVPGFIYSHLLAKLHALPPADIDPQSKGPFPLDAAFETPGKLRGKFWRVQGLIGSVRAQKCEPSGGVTEVHSATIWVGDTAVLVHVLQKPDVLVLERDTVECSGLFLKILSHRAKDGTKVDAPFFLAKSLRKYY